MSFTVCVKRFHLCFVLLLLAGVAASPPVAVAAEARAVFAGGCFWCMEPPFDKLDGVLSTTSGFAGGSVANPTYEQVSSGGTGHIEVVEIIYDSDRVTYRDLLETYWANIDPLDGGGQFCDRGKTYAPAVFYTSAGQKELAEASKEAISKRLDMNVATVIRPLDKFYPAEDYHQDYCKTHDVKYKFYRWRCGRDQRLEALWGDLAGKAVPIF